MLQPDEGEEEEPDRLHRRLSRRELRQVSEDETARLHAVRKVTKTQLRFKNSTWNLPAASGAPLNLPSHVKTLIL